jgi:anti-anti-sigma factor
VTTEFAADEPLRPLPSLSPETSALQSGLDVSDGSLLISECLCETTGLRVVGEIDLNGHDDWERALRQAADSGEEVHLDLTGLSFIDARGVALLVDVAGGMREEQRIVVLGAPPCLRRVLQVLWPDGADAIMIEGAR